MPPTNLLPLKSLNRTPLNLKTFPWTAAVLWLLWALAPGAANADCAPPPGSNHLACETSPYLQQHATNPVDWYPWGPEAFDKARREGKFIFLSIGYSTCYWCHVMERESFADAETAKLMNRYAVSIKVDREERPDLDEIYMTAVQVMMRQGGWPMTTLLTPELKPFFGGTYLPKAQLQELITNAAAIWKQDRAGVEARAESIAEAVQRAGRLPGAPLARLPAATLPARAAEAFDKTFDSFDGGFGPAPKFPMPSRLELLLDDYEARKQHSSLEMVTTTLDAMARGGIHDQVGGGFHRYSTDPQWRVPHFEKMLYDNAQLLHLYARAGKITGNADFKRVADNIVSYVQREMTGSDGLFYSAQDSETDGEEGRSYVWTVKEIERVLSKSETTLARRVWGLDGPANFEDAFILHWPRPYTYTARAAGLNVSQLHARLAPIRAKLLAARNQRSQPQRDDKSITAWNGLMIEALAYAGQVLERPDYIKTAARAANALLATLRSPKGELLHVARHGQAKLDAYLDDYAATILALLALDQAEDNPRWRAEAVQLGDAMIARLWDAGGGFHYAPMIVEHLLVRSKDSYDGVVPAGNSLATRALVIMAQRVDKRYAGYAAATLRTYGGLLSEAPQAMPYMLRALVQYRDAGLDINAAPPQAALTAVDTAGQVQASVQNDAADPRRFIITLRMKPGWHVNAAPASLDFLVPTHISARRGDRIYPVKADYPKGEPLTTRLSQPIRVYHDGVRIPARLNKNTPADVEFVIRAQACDDQGTCLAPADLPVQRKN